MLQFYESGSWGPQTSKKYLKEQDNGRNFETTGKKNIETNI